MTPKAWDSSLTLPGLIVECRRVAAGVIEMSGQLAAAEAICPDCGNLSTSFHSRYDRTLSDLPVSGSRGQLRLSVRRFRCIRSRRRRCSKRQDDCAQHATERQAGSAQTALINAVIEKTAPALLTAREVLDRFHAIMRSKDEAQLDPWIAMAAESKLAAFAAGVEADKDAVAAAISTSWSSGQVEGKINRLKAIKRQMYGRAKIDLFKARIMAPA